MARFHDQDTTRAGIDTLVEDWKRDCLVADGSLLFEDRQLWTLSNLTDFRDRFVGNPILGTDQDFEDKLTEQLGDAGEDIRWLVYELVAVYFLFARGAINGPGKRKVLEAIVAPVKTDDPPGWKRVADTMDEGIGNPGSGYNIRRDLQMGYLLDFARRIKALPPEEREAVLDDPWKSRDFADTPGDEMPVREMRHILLHLLHPDSFERISSRTHKTQIVDAFRTSFLDGDDGAPDDLDEQLLFIRDKLSELDAQPNIPGGVLDYYWPPLYGIWDPTAQAGEGASDLDLIFYKGQIVLYGPPGTSKTHRTRQLAATLIRRVALERWEPKAFFEKQDELDQQVEANVEWLQLHPGYGYEEFIRGLRLTDDGATAYEPGFLPRLVERIEMHPEDERLPVVLVLDEINRTDLSRMFGEAFSLLENRDQELVLPGLNPDDPPQTLRLPKDLYLIGTMNLIDQSVEELDFALRRRFFWRPCQFERAPIIDVNRERWAEHAPKKWGWDRAEPDMIRLGDRAVELNREIESSTHLGPQYALGHTYFFDAAFFAGRWLQGRKQLTGGPLWTNSGKPRPALEDLWDYSLQPLLAQYLEGLDAETAAEELVRLRGVFFRRGDE